MADGTGFHLNPAMGRDLMAGHVHKDRHGRSPAPAASHRPVGKKRMQHAVSDRSPKRTEAPEIPRLRALEAHAAAIPISSSAASSTSPRSGSSRVNPYPVGEAIESSPYELVPSVATQATQSWEQGGSLELTPIRDDTSPTTPSMKPTQVMSPNLGQGLASGSNQAEEGEAEMDTAMARAILQSWTETRAEDGSVQRTYTQCAREWPLLGMEAFENIETALNVLKRACEYLHEGMMQMGRTVEQKANIPSVEAAVRELAQHTQEVRNGVQRTVTRQTELSNRLDNMTEHLQAARGRMEALSAQLDHGGREHMALVVEYRQSIEETQRRLSQLGGLIEHSQVDNQRLDKGLTDLRENVFNNGVAIDHLKEDMEREVAKLSTLSGPAPEVSAYQRHAASQDEALTQCRSQLTAQAQRIEDGQQHLRRLQQEVTELIGQSTPRVEQNVPNRDPELAIRLSQLEEGMKAQQRTMKQMVKDNAEDAKDVKQYLDQVHDLLTTTLETVSATTPERATGGMTRLSKVARRGDLRIDVEDSDFCKVGEIVLVGGQEARTVMGKSSLIFKVPLNGEYPEGTTVRTLLKVPVEWRVSLLEGTTVRRPCATCGRMSSSSWMASMSTSMRRIWRGKAIWCVEWIWYIRHPLSGQKKEMKSRIKHIQMIWIRGSEEPWMQEWQLRDQLSQEQTARWCHLGRHLMPMSGVPRMARQEYPYFHRSARRKKVSSPRNRVWVTKTRSSKRRM